MNDKDKIEEVIETLDDLRLDAWGYDSSFKSYFHADVYYKLEEAISKLREIKNPTQ